MNMFFPDPNATFSERKKSKEQPEGTVYQQNITGSRGSSKHIEPHRIVKVSKPFSGNTFVNKNAHMVKVSQGGGGHKKAPLNGSGLQTGQLHLQ